MGRTEKYVRALDIMIPGSGVKPPKALYAELYRRGYQWTGKIWERTKPGLNPQKNEREVATVYIYSTSYTGAHEMANLLTANLTAIDGSKVRCAVHMADKVMFGKFRVILNFFPDDETEELPF